MKQSKSSGFPSSNSPGWSYPCMSASLGCKPSINGRPIFTSFAMLHAMIRDYSPNWRFLFKRLGTRINFSIHSTHLQDSVLLAILLAWHVPVCDAFVLWARLTKTHSRFTFWFSKSVVIIVIAWWILMIRLIRFQYDFSRQPTFFTTSLEPVQPTWMGLEQSQAE